MPPTPPLSPDNQRGLITRFRRWLFWGLAVAALLYLGGSIWVGIQDVGAELARFSLWLLLPILALVLVNYGLRFLKWHWLVRRLGVRISWRDNAWFFAAGLAMVISPAKAGELLKPWLVRTRTGVGMATTIPALVAERLTDGIAMLMLAAIGVTTYAADKVMYVAAPSLLVVAGLGVLSHRGLSMWIIRILERMPLLHRIGHKLEEMYIATRTCLSPGPLVLTVMISAVAWWAECLAYWLVFRGFGVSSANLDVATFLYAFATVAGGALPGGLGVADGALGGGAFNLVPGITEAQAVASALLVRLATLWFGVGLGTMALIHVNRVLDHIASPGEEPASLPED